MPLTIPAAWPLDQTIGVQFFMVPAALNELWAGNAFTILVKS